MSQGRILQTSMLCLCAGAVGAGLVFFLQEPRSTPDFDTQPQTLVDPAIEELQQQIALQQAHIDSLSASLRREEPERTPVDFLTQADLEEIQARLDRLEQQGVQLWDSPTEDGLQVAIDGVLEQRAEIARQEKEQRRQEAARKKDASRAQYWEQELGLTPVQTQDLEVILQQRSDGQLAIQAEIAAGRMTKSEAREPWMELEATFGDGLNALLTPVQLEQYQAMRSGK